MYSTASVPAMATRLRSRVRVRPAEISAPVRDPRATTDVSSPYPPAPEWYTDLAYAARVTARLMLNMPKMPTRTVGHRMSGRPAT